MKEKKLVYGVGINDANYNVTITEMVEGKSVRVWICPFYQRWKDMLKRCYSNRSSSTYKTYTGCYVIPEWHYFMTFRSWMAEQPWKGNQLDKDLLFAGNRIYGPDTCVFVDQTINKFLTESTATRGEFPIGVNYDNILLKFVARCRDSMTGKQVFLGLYSDVEEAHQAWLKFKLEQAHILAEQQTDSRVAKALIQRYENYGKSG